MKKKKLRSIQEKKDLDFGYDGYYNDVEPEDINEETKKENNNERTAMIIKVAGLIFATMVLIAFIVVLMVAF